MSATFWLGATSALAVWFALNTLVSIASVGKRFEYSASTVALHAGLTLVLAMGSWYLATFGGA